MAFDPISAALDIGGKLIDRLIPDPAKKAEAALELLKLQQSGELAVMTAQTDTNKVEASSNSLFVAGWRPFIGWICGSALAFQFIIRPLASWIAALWGHPVAVPALDMADLFTLLFGMLGLGGMRTYEKVQGAQSNGH
jgi:ABC-type Fe3+ transport system permease subunit